MKNSHYYDWQLQHNKWENKTEIGWFSDLFTFILLIFFLFFWRISFTCFEWVFFILFAHLKDYMCSNVQYDIEIWNFPAHNMHISYILLVLLLLILLYLKCWCSCRNLRYPYMHPMIWSLLIIQKCAHIICYFSIYVSFSLVLFHCQNDE